MSAPARRPSIAPVAALVGLVVATLLTAQIYRTWAPSAAGADATPTSQAGGPTAEASPTIIHTSTTVPGTLVYVREGSLWVQTGTIAQRLTVPLDGATASGPAWSSDGQWIYYIDTRIGTGRWYDPNQNYVIARFTLTYPVLCRIHPDGSGKEDVLSGQIKAGALRSFYWIRQPSVSPDGSTLAVISDGPTWPSVADNLLHFISLPGGKLGPAPKLPQNSPFGLSEPTYSPDGSLVAYVMEGRSGKYGAPSIWLYDVKAKTGRRLAPGYRGPSWSPDGKYLAATKVFRDKLDIVVLDAATGKQVSQVTSDGASWAPVWSPAGNGLVYMHLRNGDVSLRLVRIEGSGPAMQFRVDAFLTDYSGLDGSSRAAWYVPGASRPAATPEPSASR